MRSKLARSAVAFIVSGLLSIDLAGDARAQLKGHYLPGFTGLLSGSQAPPGISVFLPVYFYTTDEIRNDAAAYELKSLVKMPETAAGAGQ
jgi:hypothetical protein